MHNQWRFSVPDPPLSLNATATSNHSVRLSWKPPRHNNGEIHYYEIKYTLSKDWIFKNTSDASTIYDVDKLDVWTEYTFTVRACDSKGCGAWSINTSRRTHEGSELNICIPIPYTIVSFPSICFPSYLFCFSVLFFERYNLVFSRKNGVITYIRYNIYYKLSDFRLRHQRQKYCTSCFMETELGSI